MVLPNEDFQTRVFYKGQQVNIDDIQVSWCDYCGERHQGTVLDFARSESNDAVAECEAGEGW